MKDHIGTMEATKHTILGHRRKILAGKKENSAKLRSNAPMSKSTMKNVCFTVLSGC